MKTYTTPFVALVGSAASTIQGPNIFGGPDEHELGLSSLPSNIEEN